MINNKYLSGEEKITNKQSRMIKQARYTYSPLGKAFEKQIKNHWWSRKKTNWRFKKFKIGRKLQKLKSIKNIFQQKDEQKLY